MNLIKEVMSNSSENNIRTSHRQNQPPFLETPNLAKTTQHSNKNQFPPNYMLGLGPPPLMQYMLAFRARGSTLSEGTPMTYEQYTNLMAQYRAMIANKMHFANMMNSQ